MCIRNFVTGISDEACVCMTLPLTSFCIKDCTCFLEVVLVMYELQELLFSVHGKIAGLCHKVKMT